MLDKLTQHTHIDFTTSNVRAVLIWVIKNANTYFSSQLVTLVEKMTEQANIVLYKSNEKTFGADKWRYVRGAPEGLDRYALDYRVVLHRCGGRSVSEYAYERNQHNGLSASAFHFINDILTVANNMNFQTSDQPTAGSFDWSDNSSRDFFYTDGQTGKSALLMSVRCFGNGNTHIKFNQRFIMRLNIEHGRIVGWIRSPKEAASELNISVDEATAAFDQTSRWRPLGSIYGLISKP